MAERVEMQSARELAAIILAESERDEARAEAAQLREQLSKALRERAALATTCDYWFSRFKKAAPDGLICRHCRQPVQRVNYDWRDKNWLTYCGIGDQRHEPEESPTVFTVAEHDAPALVKDFAKTQCVKMRRKP